VVVEEIEMSIKADRWIRRMAEEHGMIEPFEPGQVKEVKGQRIVSYGTSSYGYDIRCSDEFKLFTNINSTIVDPKILMPTPSWMSRPVCIIPPNSFALARRWSIFAFHARPDDLSGKVHLCPMRHHRQCHPLRTRVGRVRHPGIFEYHSITLPKFIANEGVAQVIFFESDETCEVSYRDRGGKYQGQSGVTLPKI
jgi:dCTP deaminase (EC 3.5.4.13)